MFSIHEIQTGSGVRVEILTLHSSLEMAFLINSQESDLTKGNFIKAETGLTELYFFKIICEMTCSDTLFNIAAV